MFDTMNGSACFLGKIQLEFYVQFDMNLLFHPPKKLQQKKQSQTQATRQAPEIGRITSQVGVSSWPKSCLRAELTTFFRLRLTKTSGLSSAMKRPGWSCEFYTTKFSCIRDTLPEKS